MAASAAVPYPEVGARPAMRQRRCTVSSWGVVRLADRGAVSFRDGVMTCRRWRPWFREMHREADHFLAIQHGRCLVAYLEAPLSVALDKPLDLPEAEPGRKPNRRLGSAARRGLFGLRE